MRKKKKSSDTALELVDQLLSNDSVGPKKRGRPKGSKNDDSNNEQQPSSSCSKIVFVTPELYEELGSPSCGYTTARIQEYTNKCHGYYEIYLEYIRAAILWSKLAKTIDWFSSNDENHLRKCRLEIEDFKKEHGLTKHDFWEVIFIAHEFGHSRKKMLRQLRDTANLVLEYRREKVTSAKEKSKILFREIAKIPKNIPPVLNHVQLKSTTLDATDLMDNPQVQNEHACPEHLNYKGLRKPRNRCPTCIYFYQHNKKLGLKEKRNR